MKSILGCVLCLALVACGGDDDGGPGPAPATPTDRGPFISLTPDPGYPGTPGDPAEHAALFEFADVPACKVSNPTNLGVHTALRVFRSSGISDAVVGEFLGALQRYYSQYGVTFSTAFEPIDLPLHEAMVADEQSLNDYVEAETGLLPDDEAQLTPAQREQVKQTLGAALLYPQREFLRVYGTPRRPEINVVLFDRTVNDNVAEGLESLETLLGFGFSPELLSSFPADDPGAQLYSYLGLEGEFTPTIFLGVQPVHTYLDVPDVAIAHEIGHAYGLLHVPTSGNLLNQGDIACDLELDDTQLGRVKQAAGGVAHGLGIESFSLTSRAAEFVSVVERLAANYRH